MLAVLDFDARRLNLTCNIELDSCGTNKQALI